MDNNNEMVSRRINITLPEETFDKLKDMAKKEDRTWSNIIKRAIERYGGK